MRKIILLVLTVFTVPNIWSQSPEKMSYQAVIRDSDNTLITDAVVGTQISILQGSANGVVVYEEEHSIMTNGNGLLSLEIGTGTPLNGSFTTIDWSNGPYYIRTATDPMGGNNYAIVSTSQMLSVPYALYAATAGNNTPGPEGPQGIQGPPGNDGADGQDGVGIASTVDNNDGTFTINYTDGSSFTTTDLTGPRGEQGIQGPPGNDGVDGLNGTDGADGQDGVGIASTVDNNDGTFTINYTDGSSFTTADLTGPQGAQGIQGEQGPIGPTGLTGPQGVQGPPGNDGADGLNGTDGVDGQDGVGIASTVDNSNGTFTINYTDGSSFTTADLTGPQGIQGEQGPIGPTGLTGSQGIQGPPGNDGIDGLNGTDGADGQDGVGIASTVDNSNGTFTINYTDGSSFTTADLTGPQGIRGIQGEQGPTGPTGLTGPQGVQGPPGNDGVDGLNGTEGADGQDGVGIASTVDNNNGTFTINYTDGSSFTTADLTGPQGSQGIQGEQGPIGPTGATGPQGIQGPPGNDGVDGLNGQDGQDGLSAYDIWLSLGNTGTEQDFIDSLVGPEGQTGSSFGPNTTNGIFTSNTVGQLTEWVVPAGVYTIEVWLNGSVGGNGGDVINGNTDALICSGRQGGTFGSVTVILNVVPGDTISYYIGIDGSDGNDAERFTQTQVFAENGSSGETCQIYRNNILGFKLSGGGGGQGGRATGSGGCFSISDGNNGSLNMADCLENGFFPRNSTNPYSNQKQTIIIRY